MKRVVFKSRWVPVLAALPQLFLIFLFFYWPAVSVLNWAFTLEPAFGGAGARLFVGWENFQAVFSDSQYWNSVRVSVTFAVLATVITMGLALVLALAVDRQLKGSKIFRFFYIWPYALAGPAVGTAFLFILSPERGLMAMVNAAHPDFWNPAKYNSHAMILIVTCFVWKWIGYCFIFMLAGLQSIPRSLTEAAAMDGSGPLRRALDIQIPLLSPTLFLLLILIATESFVGKDTYGIVDRTTYGGPNNATNLMVFNIVSKAFEGLDYSGAAAQSLIVISLIMVFTFIQFRFIERRVHYR
ncbi:MULTISPECIES: carbohydrate ABC transporter permease [Aureimonas]|uniref:sn-glycerol-3-phosphate transport system permease protein UgpA n=1 Tax=Aureimonas ureilytica TaxID=401562 RepID=A0A175RE18_9HYPH|nr:MULTISPECIES: sugar ABC transporter permease [Aureimonas]KTQ98450.1 glycerol-3-phosphate transporter permease [Aureimonas ureilytica]